MSTFNPKLVTEGETVWSSTTATTVNTSYNGASTGLADALNAITEANCQYEADLENINRTSPYFYADITLCIPSIILSSNAYLTFGKALAYPGVEDSTLAADIPRTKPFSVLGYSAHYAGAGLDVSTLVGSTVPLSTVSVEITPRFLTAAGSTYQTGSATTFTTVGISLSTLSDGNSTLVSDANLVKAENGVNGVYSWCADVKITNNNSTHKVMMGSLLIHAFLKIEHRR